MAEQNQNVEDPLNSWDGFLGNQFLSTDEVRDSEHEFAVTDVEMDTENNRPILLLESGDIKTKFSLNVTNSHFVKNEGYGSPKQLIGKKIKFNKVKAFSPSKKKEVDSLRIRKIIDPEKPETSQTPQNTQ